MMRHTRKAICWRCEGEGDLTDDDSRPRFCPSCMGMGTLSVATTEPQSEDDLDGWYEDPQPARLSDA